MSVLSFNNRAALITGASTGIGASTAIKLADAGVKTVINYYLADFLPAIPLKRVGTADEVAGLIAYLTSDQAGFVTGSVFHINGGEY